jgi:UDP-N-acetylmuramoyl-tripeptide--D-alanyl-D-alanine ligase
MKELVRLRRRRAIAILGDMLELGPYAEEAHRRLGRWMASLPVDLFVAVGPLMSKAAEEFLSSRGQLLIVQDSSEAAVIFRNIRREGDTVLLKGSRGMRMEKVLEEFPETELVRTGSEARDAL